MSNYMNINNVRKISGNISVMIAMISVFLLFISLPVQAMVPNYWINVEDYGANGSDAIDDTDEIQDAIDAAASGSVIYFPKGIYRISDQLLWSNKSLHLLGFGDATILETTVLNEAMISMNTASGSSITGINGQGAETYANFAGASGLLNAFIYVVNSNNVEISNSFITAKSYGIILYGGEKCKVTDCNITGVLTSPKTGQYYSAGCWVIAGSQHIVCGLIGQYLGSGVLVTSAGAKHNITNCQFRTMQESGVYLQSGSDNIVCNATIIGIGANDLSTGVRAAGSRNNITSCLVKDCYTGYRLSGKGTTLDSDGANGSGMIIQGCVAENILGDGVYIVSESNYYGRNFSIIGNQLNNCATLGGDVAPIRCLGGNGIILEGNTITYAGGNYAISFGTTTVFHGAVIVNNVISGATTGIRLRYINGATVRDNMFRNVSSYCVDLGVCSQCQISGNWGVDNTPSDIVKCASADSNTDNVLRGNRGSSITVDAQTNYVTDNIPTTINFVSSVASAPNYVGQLAKVGTAIYIAVGTSSSSDWKQITN